MKFFLMRHAEAESGDPMDIERTLTATGEKEIPIVIDFLKSVTKDIGLVICSDMHRGIDTAKPIAEAYDVDLIRSPWVGPEIKPERAWKEIVKIAKANLTPDEQPLIVTHGKLVNCLAAWLLESGEGDKFHFIHGAVAKFDTEAPGNYGPYNGGDKGQPAVLHWMVTPKVMLRVAEDDPKAVIEAALKLADATLESLGARFDEAKGEYYMDTTLVKRVTEGGSQSGPCDNCEDNIGEGWIDADDVYPTGDDGPPFHPNCVCIEEYKEKRVRVYV